MLDEKVTVFYSHEEATVDVSNIENGDTVTVTGRFAAPDTIYATKIEKNWEGRYKSENIHNFDVPTFSA